MLDLDILLFLKINFIPYCWLWKNKHPKNFALHQWENREIANIKNQEIKQILFKIQKCPLWIYRNYGYPNTKVPNSGHLFRNSSRHFKMTRKKKTTRNPLFSGSLCKLGNQCMYEFVLWRFSTCTTLDVRRTHPIYGVSGDVYCVRSWL